MSVIEDAVRTATSLLTGKVTLSEDRDARLLAEAVLEMARERASDDTPEVGTGTMFADDDEVVVDVSVSVRGRDQGVRFSLQGRTRLSDPHTPMSAQIAGLTGGLQHHIERAFDLLSVKTTGSVTPGSGLTAPGQVVGGAG